ncbi:MAG: hydrolase [Gammaproteobacteria bacterium]|nr:hydrolase [Gammaproteobacteria bacterium]
MTLRLNECALIVVDLQEKLLPKICDQEQLVKNCEWLARAAVKLDIPLLACEQYPSGLGNTSLIIRQHISIDAIIEKTTFSAARDIIFTDRLAALNRKQVILCGIEAHVCILQTALDLKNMDYEVYVVADAIGSRNNTDKQYSIQRMIQNNIFLLTKEMVVFECLEKSGTDLFKAMSKEFLK